MSAAHAVIEEQVALAPWTTFGIGGPARWFTRARSDEELVAALAWAKERKVAAFLLGGGSNLLVRDAGFSGLVIRMELLGIAQKGELLDVAAGESWDDLVSFAVQRGFAGMECLAGIPGSTGATPVQNVGAYGQEVADTIESVRAFDRREERFVDLSHADCRFRYRASLLNTEEPGRYAVTQVRFRLRGGGEPQLKYPDLRSYFKNSPEPPTLPAVADAVRCIRRGKGMVLVEGDPDTQSAGSYFKNPIVSSDRLPGIAKAAEVEPSTVPAYPAGEGQAKLSAAWLVERAGFARGFRLGAAGLSTRHTLALSNRGGASCADVLQLEQHIRSGVERRFGIPLEREPVLLGDAALRAAPR